MKNILLVAVAMVVLTFPARSAHAQDAEAPPSDSSVFYARQFQQAKTAQLQQYDHDWQKAQQQLIRKLRKKEQRILKLLAQKDSAAYKNYLHNRLDFDSLQVLSASEAKVSSLARLPYPGLDQLKATESMLPTQTALMPGNPLAGSSATLDKALSGRGMLDNLISTRAHALQSLAETHGLPGVDKIKQALYYGQARVAWLRQKTAEPDEAEQQALEYLQGTPSFGNLLSSMQSAAFGGLGNHATEADLTRLGYQTKSMVNSQVQQQLGNNTDAVLQQVGQNLQSYTGPYSGYIQKAAALRAALPGYEQQAQTAVSQAQASARKATRSLTQPGFHVNPQAVKPFRDRWALQYNFQAAKAAADGSRPAITEIGISAVYKQNTWLSFSAGMAASIGMGSSLAQLKASYEGVSLRAAATGVWRYGIGLQAGYERYFIPSGRQYLSADTNETGNALGKVLGSGGNVAYMGIVKQYRINKKWNGSFLLGYNFLWKATADIRTPFIIRFAWSR